MTIQSLAHAIIERKRKRFEGCEQVALTRGEFEVLASEIEGKEPPAFRIPVEREAPSYTALEQRRIDRLNEEDARAQRIREGVS